MTLECPRCGVGELKEIEAGEVIIDRCNTCAGLWFDQGEIGAILGNEALIKEIESNFSQIETELACPRCKKINLRAQKIKPGATQINIYRCPSCLGSWLDRGEFCIVEDTGVIAGLKQLFK